MKKIIIAVTALFVALSFATSANAASSKSSGPKASVMAKYDANKDGQLDAEEIAAIRKDYAANPKDPVLKRFDKDNDGQLSDAEIAQMIPGSGDKSKDSKDKKADDKKKDDKKKDDKKSTDKKSSDKKSSSKKNDQES